MTRFPATQSGRRSVVRPLLFAGLAVVWTAGAHAGPAPPAKKIQTATILGYVFDPDGKPAADATVCLTKNSDSDDETADPSVLAQSTSAANGRFELKPTAEQIKLDPTDPSSVLEIWIHRPGLATAHAAIVPEQLGQPIIISLHNMTGTPIRVLWPDRSPCKDATVTPTHASVSDGDWFAIPKPIKDRLKVHTAADGRASLPNFDGQNQVISIEKPGFGVQMLTIRGQRPCPLPVVLRRTHSIEGQVLLPKGVTTDLSQMKLRLYVWRLEERRTHCPRGNADAHWWVEQIASVDRDGHFVFPSVLDGCRGYLSLPYGTGLVEKYSLSARCVPGLEKSDFGVVAVLRVRVPWHILSASTFDATLRVPIMLPWQLALFQAAWSAVHDVKLHLDLPLAKAVRVTRVLRNAETTEPLAGIRVYCREAPQAKIGTGLEKCAPWLRAINSVRYASECATAVEWLYEQILAPWKLYGSEETSQNGMFDACLEPGKDYELAWEPPQGFVGAGRYSYESFHVPSGSEYVEKLKRDFCALTPGKVDEKLHKQGTSLAALKKEFRYRLLADEYVRQVRNAQAGIDRARLLAYYREHRASYAVRAKVSWQMLEIEFENQSARRPQAVEQASARESCPWTSPPPPQDIAKRLDFHSSSLDKPLSSDEAPHSTETANPFDDDKSPGQDSKKDDAIDTVKYADEWTHTTRKQARGKLAEALAMLKKGVAFEAVTKKFSSGPTAGQGGWQARVDPEIIADKQTADALRQLPEGQMSEVIETDHSFRVIRVVSRAPAGDPPFEEVEASIKHSIAAELQKEALEELYSRTTVESPYLDESGHQERTMAPCPQKNADAFSE